MAFPTTLKEAFKALDDLLCQEDRDYIQKAADPDKVAIRLHHTLGRHIRNEFGLWQNSELVKLIVREHGITHPDDMSHFILVEYARQWIPTTWERL